MWLPEWRPESPSRVPTGNRIVSVLGTTITRVHINGADGDIAQCVLLTSVECRSVKTTWSTLSEAEVDVRSSQINSSMFLFALIRHTILEIMEQLRTILEYSSQTTHVVKLLFVEHSWSESAVKRHLPPTLHLFLTLSRLTPLDYHCNSGLMIMVVRPGPGTTTWTRTQDTCRVLVPKFISVASVCSSHHFRPILLGVDIKFPPFWRWVSPTVWETKMSIFGEIPHMSPPFG